MMSVETSMLHEGVETWMRRLQFSEDQIAEICENAETLLDLASSEDALADTRELCEKWAPIPRRRFMQALEDLYKNSKATPRVKTEPVREKKEEVPIITRTDEANNETTKKKKPIDVVDAYDKVDRVKRQRRAPVSESPPASPKADARKRESTSPRKVRRPGCFIVEDSAREKMRQDGWQVVRVGGRNHYAPAPRAAAGRLPETTAYASLREAALAHYPSLVVKVKLETSMGEGWFQCETCHGWREGNECVSCGAPSDLTPAVEAGDLLLGDCGTCRSRLAAWQRVPTRCRSCPKRPKKKKKKKKDTLSLRKECFARLIKDGTIRAERILFQKNNPRATHANQKTAMAWDAYSRARTVEDALAKGARKIDLSYDLARGWARLPDYDVVERQRDEADDDDVVIDDEVIHSSSKSPRLLEEEEEEEEEEEADDDDDDDDDDATPPRRAVTAEARRINLGALLLKFKLATASSFRIIEAPTPDESSTTE